MLVKRTLLWPYRWHHGHKSRELSHVAACKLGEPEPAITEPSTSTDTAQGKVPQRMKSTKVLVDLDCNVQRITYALKAPQAQQPSRGHEHHPQFPLTMVLERIPRSVTGLGNGERRHEALSAQIGFHTERRYVRDCIVE